MILINSNKHKILPLSKIPINPVPLRRSDPSSPWCYCASLSPLSLDLNNNDDASLSPPSQLLPPGTNFLATQVWPSSRTASFVLERHLDPSWTVCELGCGPGLPSLTSAKCGARKVIATDVDRVALEMVRLAAFEQGFVSEGAAIGGKEEDERFVTREFDLTRRDDALPEADLYVLSDVFESSRVAEGAAWHVKSLLETFNNKIDGAVESDGNDPKAPRVWVFAQSDRAQREVFLNSLKENNQFHHLQWTTNHVPDKDALIWLFDLNEMDVQYN